MAPKTISSQEGTERRERRLGLGAGTAGARSDSSCSVRLSTWASGTVGALWAEAAAWGEADAGAGGAGDGALGAEARRLAAAG